MFGPPVCNMARRSIAILTLVSLLFLSFGLVDALHLGHDHDHGDSHKECQVCFLAKIATIGVTLGVALYVLFNRQPDTIPLIAAARPARVGHGGPQSPRAPPLG